MTSIEHLIQQNILEHESRLKHIDELIERARNRIVKDPEHAEIRDSLASMTQERDKYYSWLKPKLYHRKVSSTSKKSLISFKLIAFIIKQYESQIFRYQIIAH